MADKLWKADSASQALELLANARIAQKNFMAEKDPEYVETFDTEIAAIDSLCDKLSAAMKQQDQQGPGLWCPSRRRGLRCFLPQMG